MPRIVPVLPSEVPGNYQTGALWNAGPKALADWATAQPVFIGYQATAQSIPNAVFTAFNIDTEVLDSDGGHSTVTNTSRYTATVPGVYLVIGSSGWVGNTAGLRRVRIALNGTAILGSGVGVDAHAASSSVTGHQSSTFVQMNGTTDYIEVQGYQTSGAALNTNANSDFCPSMRVFWLRT